MKTYNFYDTSSLLIRGEHLFDDPNENIIISSITLNELENIKSSNRDSETKACARRLLRTLDANPDAYDVWVYMSTMLEGHVPDMSCWEINNDIKILASAVTYDKTIHPDETVFITEDLSLKQIANHYFGSDSIRKATPPPPDIYNGYKEIAMTEEEMANFYEDSTNNIYNLNINEYIIVKNEYDEIVDTLCWTGEEHRPLKYGSFDSRHLGKVKPMKNDIYQAILADSFLNNTITLVKGPAGTGKSYMSLAFLFSQLDAGKIDKIIIFCNTVATKNSAKLGLK